jgi:hypothetical protein
MEENFLTDLGINTQLRPEDILRTILFQMSMSRYQSDNAAFEGLADWLEMLLTPYKDDIHRLDMEELDRKVQKEIEKASPKNQNEVIAEQKQRYSRERLQILIMLMDRKGLLLPKKASEQV